LRAVLQRVDKAKVTVAGQSISSIEKGLLVFLGVETGDSLAEAKYVLEKISNLQVFEDHESKMNLSLLDIDGACLWFRSSRSWPIAGEAGGQLSQRPRNRKRLRHSTIISLLWRRIKLR